MRRWRREFWTKLVDKCVASSGEAHPESAARHGVEKATFEPWLYPLQDERREVAADCRVRLLPVQVAAGHGDQHLLVEVGDGFDNTRDSQGIRQRRRAGHRPFHELAVREKGGTVVLTYLAFSENLSPPSQARGPCASATSRRSARRIPKSPDRRPSSTRTSSPTACGTWRSPPGAPRTMPLPTVSEHGAASSSHQSSPRSPARYASACLSTGRHRRDRRSRQRSTSRIRTLAHPETDGPRGPARVR